MTRSPPLYELLPELYRNRDARAMLRALTEVLDGPRAAVEENIGALYRDWFVETCQDWALFYLARLAGCEGPAPFAADRRALVADAIAFARRKGTYPALNHELAATTGWPVQVTFDAARGAAVVRYWDEPAYALREATPSSDGAGRFRFHPLGIDCPLFSAPRPHPGLEAPFDPALDAPAALAMDADPALLGHAIAILVEEKERGEEETRLLPILPHQMAYADLGDWRAPAGTSARAFVDPLRGRFLLAGPPARAVRVAVSFAYAAAGNVGGGPYERELARPDEDCWIAYVHADAKVTGVTEAKTGAEHGTPAFRTLAEALDAFRRIPGDGLIRILDSDAYEVGDSDLGAAPLVCLTNPNTPRRLVIEALSGETPVLRGTLRFGGGGTGLRLGLNGLWIDGRIEIGPGVEARFEHCSIRLPAQRGVAAGGRPSAAIVMGAKGAVPLSLTLHACLTGPLLLGMGAKLAVIDSVVDGDGGLAISGRPAAMLLRSTLLGGADLGVLDATDTILSPPLTVTGASRVRHCFVPESAGLPGVSNSISHPAPVYEGTSIGRPGYARLDRAVGGPILTGASNGSEIGVFNEGHGAQRLALIEARLASTLPIGMRCMLERQPLAPLG